MPSSPPPPAPPSGSPQAQPSPTEVGRLISATTQVDYGKKVHPAELPFAEAVRLAGALAWDGAAPPSPPPVGGAPKAADARPRTTQEPGTPSTPPPPPLPAHLSRLGVEQFATYCAQRAANPNRAAEIDERYGITDDDARSALERHWHERLAADPSLMAVWREHLERARRYVKRLR